MSPDYVWPNPGLSARAFRGHTSLPYIVLELDGYYHIWRVLDGVPTRITEAYPSFNERFDPRLSMDGTAICYTERVTGLYTVRAIDSDGTNDRELYDASGGSAGPAAWSPPGWSSGATLVLYTTAGGIFSANADGSGVIPGAIVAGSTLAKPKFDPDGNSIAFQGELAPPIGIADGLPDLYKLDTSSGGYGGISRVAVLRTKAGGFDFAYHPGGGGGLSWGDGTSVGTNGNWRSGNVSGNIVLNATPPSAIDQVVGTFAPHIEVVPLDVFTLAYYYAMRFTGLGGGYELYRYITGIDAPQELALGHNTTGQIGLGPTCFDDRVWFMQRTPGILYSCAIDGSDLMVEHDLSDNGVGDDFYLSTGFNSNR